MNEKLKKEIENETDYSPTTKAVMSSQREVKDAWVGGKYPVKNEASNSGIIRTSSDNFKGIQKKDGSGTLRHYRTREAIRTKNGLIIDNTECWSRGFAKCTPPYKERDTRLPLTSINSEYRDKDIYSIKEVIQEEGLPRIAVFEDGTGIAFCTDGTAKLGNSNFIFELSKEEVSNLEKPEDVMDLITPREVLETNKEVKRQGEWFFIPTNKEVNKENIEKPLKNQRKPDGSLYRFGDGDENMESHIARDKAKENGNIYIRGTVRHLRQEHDMINLEETWHKAVTHDRTCHITGSSNGGRVD